jgi:hypothetical protein
VPLGALLRVLALRHGLVRSDLWLLPTLANLLVLGILRLQLVLGLARLPAAGMYTRRTGIL